MPTFQYALAAVATVVLIIGDGLANPHHHHHPLHHHHHPLHGGYLGPPVPFGNHGGPYGLGLNGEMSYGYQYPAFGPVAGAQPHPYIDGPPGRQHHHVDPGFLGPAPSKEPAIARQFQPLLHGGGGGGGRGPALHDFHTAERHGETGGGSGHYQGDVGRQQSPVQSPPPPPLPPLHGPLPKELAGGPTQANFHGPLQNDQFQPHIARGIVVNPAVDGLVHGGFRVPLPKDADLRTPSAPKLPNPMLGQLPLRPVDGYPFKGSVADVASHRAAFAQVGKGSFGIGPGILGGVGHGLHKPPGSLPRRPFLTPVARYSDGYAYHRVPLALVEGGFVGHHFGTPVVDGVVNAGIPVSLARGW